MLTTARIIQLARALADAEQRKIQSQQQAQWMSEALVSLHNHGVRAYDPRKLPTISQHYEFGWCLTTNEPTLIHCVQGVYDDVPQ